MRKILYFTFVLLIFLNFNVYTSQLNVGINEAYKTVQDAVNKAMDGDVIRIMDGNYFYDGEIIIQNKNNLTIIGTGKVHLTCPNEFRENDYLAVIRIINSKNIIIKNIHAQHKEETEWQTACGGSVIHISKSENIQILECELNGSGAIGVEAKDTKNLIIDKCYIHKNSWAAFSFQETKPVLVKNCKIINNYRLYSEGRMPKEGFTWENNNTENNGE